VPRPEHARPVERGDRGLAHLRANRAVFLRRLGGVNLERDPVATGEGVGLAHDLEGRGVERMGRHGRHYPRMVAVLAQERLRPREGGLGCLVVRGGEADDGLPEHTPKAGPVHGAGDFLLKVVHVREGGGSAPGHLDAGQERSPVHELSVDVLGLGRENDALQPFHEREVVRDSSEQDHGGVTVRVDQAGDDQVPAGVEGLPRLGQGLAGGEDGLDDPAADRHRASLEHPHLGIHGDHGAPTDEQVDGAGFEEREEEEGRDRHGVVREFYRGLPKVAAPALT
jgi:hypothetical protein